MKIFLNKRMNFFSKKINFEIPKKLSSFIEEGFFIENGCVFFKKNGSFISPSIWDSHHDKTGVECFVNQINIDDYISHLDEGTLFLLLLKATEILEEKVLSSLKGRFVIIGSLQTTDFLTAKLRFHSLRNAEEWIDVENIENYEEAVFVKLLESL